MIFARSPGAQREARSKAPSLIARFLAFFSRSAALADGMRARRVTARDPAVHGVRHGYIRVHTRRANTYSVNLSSAHTWRRRDHRDCIPQRELQFELQCKNCPRAQPREREREGENSRALFPRPRRTMEFRGVGVGGTA